MTFHRCDLTKEQRDEHIRRYAELLEMLRDVQSTQNAAIESKREDGRGHRLKGVARQVAEETGLSVDTVRRAALPTNTTRQIRDAEAENPGVTDPERNHHRLFVVGQCVGTIPAPFRKRLILHHF